MKTDSREYGFILGFVVAVMLCLIVFSATSCSKVDDEYCYECVTKTWKWDDGTYYRLKDKHDTHCGLTEGDAILIELDGTYLIPREKKVEVDCEKTGNK